MNTKLLSSGKSKLQYSKNYQIKGPKIVNKMVNISLTARSLILLKKKKKRSLILTREEEWRLRGKTSQRRHHTFS